MKKFTLGCENNHEFEGWFADAEAIRQQLSNGLLDCPYCGSKTLEKRLSAPNLSTPKTRARIAAEHQQAPPPVSSDLADLADLAGPAGPAGLPPVASSSAPPSVPKQQPHAAISPAAGDGAAALRMAVRALHQKIQAEFTNVGDKFADEARKIHHGETDQQNIYGTCTADEQRELAEDGIEVLPLPDLPPEH